jgi:hypothetical protein
MARIAEPPARMPKQRAECTVHLATTTCGNFELWGNPLTGWCMSRGNDERGTSDTCFGDRRYFQGWRTRITKDDILTEAGKSW